MTCNQSYHTANIASLLIAPSHTRIKYKMVTIFCQTYEDYENLERTHGWCSAVGKVAF